MPRRLVALVGALVLVVAASSTAAAATDRTSTPTSLASDATTSVLEGIDVSHWQGTINWTKVAAAGKKFAIIKATDSIDFVDNMYATNHAAAKAAGLWTGAYHFARPDATSGDAIREADWFAAHAALGTGDLIPALDLEVTGGLSITALQAWVTAWLKEVTAKVGIRPMIYTSPAFWKKAMGDTTALADAGYKTLWVAHWGVTSPTVPASNWGGHGWTFWQYSDCGSVPGISGCVDLDRYNGTDLAAQAYSVFKLAASLPSGSIKQGASSAALVSILRTNFSSEVALDVSGLPTGTMAEFDTNPTAGTSTSMTVTVPGGTAAVATGTYPLTITGVSGDLRKTTKLNLVVSDGLPPTVVAPFTGFSTGRSLGTSSVPVRIRWSASDPSGIASYGLQRSVNGGTWTSLRLGSATATTLDENFTIGSTVQHRVRATDRNANMSGWLAGPVVRSLLTQQSASSVTYSGTWRTAGSTSASGGSTRYAMSAGASATYRFTGSSIALVAPRGPTRGSIRVYLDGAYAGAISLYRSTAQARVLVFARNWTTTGNHTLKVVVVGTAGHPRVDIDAFVRLAV